VSERKADGILRALNNRQTQKAIFITNPYANQWACPTNRFRFWFASSQNI